MDKILFVSNWDWVTYNFRRGLAHAVKEQGYEVVLVSPDGKYVDALQEDGFRWIEWPLDRRSLNPIREVSAIWKLARIYEQEAPDLVHHDTIKPNLYGSLAALINVWRGVRASPPQVLNSFMGLGFLFTDHPLARVLRPVVVPIMRFAMFRDYVSTTFSNIEDRNTFLRRNLVSPDRTRIMVSEFVDTEHFAPNPNGVPRNNTLVVLMAARLLWDKGVEEFVKAAQLLREKDIPVELWLAGEPDTDAPGFVPEAKLREWDELDLIEWLGYRSDMPELLRRADVAVLPTHYNEGLPRFLVEAAATGLPLVSTDLEACRQVVDDEKNGFIIPTRSPTDLSDAIEKLATDAALRTSMGKASREKALNEFAERETVGDWLDLYDQLLAASTR